MMDLKKSPSVSETLDWARTLVILGRDELGEELVAELGAAFLCAALALTPEPRPDHAGYVASWLKLLRDDHRAIVQASSLATRAVEFLHVKAEERLHDRPPSVAAA